MALVALAFALANFGIHRAIRSGFNLRFADPSLTQVQVAVGALMIVMILLLGPQIHFMAVPLYSVLFVFAMLKLRQRQLIVLEVFVLCTYGGALAGRAQLYAGQLDPRIEMISATLIVVSSVWFAVAATYISGLRARLGETVRTIEQLALRDGLTGAWNRRHIDTLLAAEMQRQSRTGDLLCACMIDVDHFKSINDHFGHQVGDAVLRQVAGSLQAGLRATDHLGRFGGEEFLILLPDATLPQARHCAERLRTGTGGLALLPGDEPVGVSVGLAAFVPGESAESFIARVDAAMYKAKRAGRNRLVIDVALLAHEGAPPPLPGSVTIAA